MQLTQKNLDKFKHIYKQKFNIDITDKEALEYGTSLVNFMKLILTSNNKKIGD